MPGDAEIPLGPTRIVIQNDGVTLPTWLSIVLGVVAFLSALTLAGVLMIGASVLNKLDLAIELQRQQLAQLVLHAQDIENVLIRSRLAGRSDFAPWLGFPVQPEQVKKSVGGQIDVHKH